MVVCSVLIMVSVFGGSGVCVVILILSMLVLYALACFCLGSLDGVSLVFHWKLFHSQ